VNIKRLKKYDPIEMHIRILPMIKKCLIVFLHFPSFLTFATSPKKFLLIWQFSRVKPNSNLFSFRKNKQQIEFIFLNSNITVFNKTYALKIKKLIYRYFHSMAKIVK
jgi:hypothetical protein